MTDETRCTACGKVRQRFAAQPEAAEGTPPAPPVCTDCWRAGVRPETLRR